MFRSADWTHDMIIVKWREVTVIQFFRKPNLSEYLPNVPKCRFSEVSIFRSVDFPKCRFSEVSIFRSVDFPKCRFSEVSIFRSVDFPKCRFSEVSIYRSVDFPKCRFSEVSIFRSVDFPKCGLNTRHDNREVTLIHLTRAQTLRSDKCATASIHANGPMTINLIPC